MTSSRYRPLEKLLKSLQEQTFSNFDITLVCIRTSEKLKEMALKFDTKLFEDGGKGRNYARNLGATKTTGKIIAFLDDDVVLQKDWLELIVKNFYKNSIGGVGGIPISTKDKGSSFPLNYATIYYKVINKARGLSRGPIYGGRVDFLSGSNMAFRRNVFLQVGGFDENFYGPSASEDVDICLRIVERGYYLLVAPKAEVYHHSDFVKRVLTFHNKHPGFFLALADNQTYCIVKNQTIRNLKWFPYLLFRFLNAIYWMIRTQNIRVFFAYVKGILKGRIRAKLLDFKSSLGSDCINAQFTK